MLGSSMWAAAKPYYDSLTLANDGDSVEMEAASSSPLPSAFPHYQTFWKRHVCPATNRPQDICFRPGVADIVSVITQRSYSVFTYMLDAYESLSLVMKGDYGSRKRNVNTTIMFAGNALQVFAELQSALCGVPRVLNGMNDLSRELGISVCIFPDWNTHWANNRESASKYRNYLTHQGIPYSVTHAASGRILVLQRDTYLNATYTWTQADGHYASRPHDWVDLAVACKEVVEDTTAFLDLAYERILAQLDGHLSNPAYQRLWGWKDNQPIPSMSSACLVQTTTPQRHSVNLSMSASTSSAVESKPAIVSPVLSATHQPASGVKNV